MMDLPCTYKIIRVAIDGINDLILVHQNWHLNEVKIVYVAMLYNVMLYNDNYNKIK